MVSQKNTTAKNKTVAALHLAKNIYQETGNTRPLTEVTFESENNVKKTTTIASIVNYKTRPNYVQIKTIHPSCQTYDN